MTVVNVIISPFTNLWRAASTSEALREISRAMKGLGFRLVRRTPNKAQLKCLSKQPVATVDERYLSYSIDISVLAGGFWWEGSSGMQRGLGTLRVPALDLNNKQLELLSTVLNPGGCGSCSASTVYPVCFPRLHRVTTNVGNPAQTAEGTRRSIPEAALPLARNLAMSQPQGNTVPADRLVPSGHVGPGVEVGFHGVGG